MAGVRGRATTIAIGAIALTAVLVGCATSTSGTATPSTDPNSAASPGHPQAPKVADPLDPSAMVAAPCTSLTEANVRDVGFDNPISQPDKGNNGNGCAWAGEGGGNMNIAWETANKHGLGDLYTTQSNFAYWLPTTIDGYPGVFADAVGDFRSRGDCVLNVGVNDQLTFFIQYDNPLTPTQGCPSAAKAAADVIANLKAGT